MSGGLLGTAVSGLMAFQRSIQTTSHNIANANTEGYSRQRVESGTSQAQYSSAGYIGTGVSISNVSRSYDQFVNGQLRLTTSAFAEVDSYKNYALQIDNILADPSTGMEPAIQSFFRSVNDVANNPSDLASRTVLLTEGEGLTHRFASVGGQLNSIHSQVNSDLVAMTDTINNYTDSIANLNKQISTDLSKTNGQQQPNDLMDQRDTILQKLAELVDISTIPQATGTIEVVMSNGQPLVMDAQAMHLGTQGNKFDPTKLEVTLVPENSAAQVISSQLMGGKLSGVLRFREEVLEPAQQQMGTVAAAILMEVNALHQKGYDLDGNQGQAFFKINGASEVPAIAVSTNNGSAVVNATFNDINSNPAGASSADLNSSDYLLEYDGTNYSLTNINDNTTIQLTATPGFPSTLTPANPSDKLPGISLEIDAAPAADDQFFIRPSHQTSTMLSMNITDPRDIAAATNLDTDGVTIISGAQPGDNRNALDLADLANKTTGFGSSVGFQEAYAHIVSKVGGLTHAADISATAQQAVLERATETRESISGVNLDEEAASLIKFQQSYQAAAQAISTASSLFDSLISAVRA